MSISWHQIEAREKNKAEKDRELKEFLRRQVEEGKERRVKEKLEGRKVGNDAGIVLPPLMVKQGNLPNDMVSSYIPPQQQQSTVNFDPDLSTTLQTGKTLLNALQARVTYLTHVLQTTQSTLQSLTEEFENDRTVLGGRLSLLERRCLGVVERRVLGEEEARCRELRYIEGDVAEMEKRVETAIMNVEKERRERLLFHSNYELLESRLVHLERLVEERRVETVERDRKDRLLLQSSYETLESRLSHLDRLLEDERNLRNEMIQKSHQSLSKHVEDRFRSFDERVSASERVVEEEKKVRGDVIKMMGESLSERFEKSIEKRDKVIHLRCNEIETVLRAEIETRIKWGEGIDGVIGTMTEQVRSQLCNLDSTFEERSKSVHSSIRRIQTSVLDHERVLEGVVVRQEELEVNTREGVKFREGALERLKGVDERLVRMEREMGERIKREEVDKLREVVLGEVLERVGKRQKQKESMLEEVEERVRRLEEKLERRVDESERVRREKDEKLRRSEEKLEKRLDESDRARRDECEKLRENILGAQRRQVEILERLDADERGRRVDILDKFEERDRKVEKYFEESMRKWERRVEENVRNLGRRVGLLEEGKVVSFGYTPEIEKDKKVEDDSEQRLNASHQTVTKPSPSAILSPAQQQPTIISSSSKPSPSILQLASHSIHLPPNTDLDPSSSPEPSPQHITSIPPLPPPPPPPPTTPPTPPIINVELDPDAQPDTNPTTNTHPHIPSLPSSPTLPPTTISASTSMTDLHERYPPKQRKKKKLVPESPSAEGEKNGYRNENGKSSETIHGDGDVTPLF